MFPELGLALKLLFPLCLQDLGGLHLLTESHPQPHVFYFFLSSTQGGRELSLSKDVAPCMGSGGHRLGHP